MIRLLRAELLKLFTVRSTYALLGIALLATIFFSFYVIGYRMAANTAAITTINDGLSMLLSQVLFFVIIIGVLLVTHEYRYNTIIYSMTAANNRLKLLLAKILVVSALAVVATIVLTVAAYALVQAGVAVKGGSVSWEGFAAGDLLWRYVFYGWGSAMYALLFAFIIRNQVGTIAALLLLPGVIEGLLGMLLKENNFYLPFSALTSVLIKTPLEHGKAALVVLIYLVVAWAIAALLFKRRDAN